MLECTGTRMLSDEVRPHVGSFTSSPIYKTPAITGLSVRGSTGGRRRGGEEGQTRQKEQEAEGAGKNKSGAKKTIVGVTDTTQATHEVWDALFSQCGMDGQVS